MYSIHGAPQYSAALCLKCLQFKSIYSHATPFALPAMFHQERFVGRLAFDCSFHAHVRVLLLLFLAALTPTLLVRASYDSGLLIVFMT